MIDISALLKKTYPGSSEDYLFLVCGDERKGVPSLKELLLQELGSLESSDAEKVWAGTMNAMDDYLNDYPGTSVYKQKLWNVFFPWLRRLAHALSLPFSEEALNRDLPRPLGHDFAIDLIKDLHYSRDGITKAELAAKYKVSERTVKNTIDRLNSEKSGELRIAGQKVSFPIREIYDYDRRDQVTRRKFSASATVNPVFLTFNIAQIHALLNSLKCSYYDEGRNMSLGIAVEIWSQLSPYTQDRIRLVYFPKDPQFREFIEMADVEASSAQLHSYHTECEQLKEEDLSPYEMDELECKLQM